MAKAEPVDSGYKPMTRRAIIPGLVLAIVFAVIALIAPIGAWFGMLMPSDRALPDWFMRSGAVTAVFAFAAQEQASNVLEKLSPKFMGSKEINRLRQVFIKPLLWIKRFIFWLAIAGSLIWAYGDMAKAAVLPSS
ncbi:hypothetical protein [Pseudomonas donghuensis]|uniref:hypothetical protein n=1 Tax=Pseudomonas donghuensis TaxID=1163398 RepID=UPI002E163051|nr:hypothetical protein VP780_10280 [Pseudomonas donghuensis]